jgi:hypothetical protein
MAGTGLKSSRIKLNEALACTPTEEIPAQWSGIKPLIVEWWTCYKRWEAQDTFKKAYDEKRMTVRAFKADFDREVHKKLAQSDFSVAPSRIFADSKRTELDEKTQFQHSDAMRDPAARPKYWQDRGIDSTEFAKPANFVSRDAKYTKGLHDLSASLVKPNKPLNLQLFYSGDGQNLAFVPLSKEEDQQVIWKLTVLAKGLQAKLVDFYTLIRGYRAEMTRIKIARDYDLGAGFIASPIANPGNGPSYRLKYGLGTTIKVTGKKFPIDLSLVDQQKLQVSLHLEAMNFKRILKTASMDTGQVNEIVIALRKHAGPFPVYAKLRIDLGYCECYDIVADRPVWNGHRISIANGTVT